MNTEEGPRPPRILTIAIDENDEVTWDHTGMSLFEAQSLADFVSRRWAVILEFTMVGSLENELLENDTE